MLSHSGEKPHHCKECGRSFSQTEKLKMHLCVQTGGKPYSANSAISQVLNPLTLNNTWPDIQQQLTSFVLW